VNCLWPGRSATEVPTGGQDDGTGDEPLQSTAPAFSARSEFAALVRKHGAERGAKGFTCGTQLAAMLFCQLAHTDSLREICNGLSCCLGKLVHLGIGKAPNNRPCSPGRLVLTLMAGHSRVYSSMMVRARKVLPLARVSIIFLFYQFDTIKL